MPAGWQPSGNTRACRGSAIAKYGSSSTPPSTQGTGVARQQVIRRDDYRVARVVYGVLFIQNVTQNS